MAKCKIIKEGHKVIQDGITFGLGDTVDISPVDAFGRKKNWLEEIGKPKKETAKANDK